MADLLSRVAAHWATRVLAVFVASRVVTTGILLVVAQFQPASDRTSAQPGLEEFSNIWDGQWYWVINGWGYPTEIPRDADGHATESAWAFLPAYPMLLRLVTALGVPFPSVAPVASALFAGAAMLVLYRLFVRFLPPGSALFGVALFALAPLSTILQVSYAESMHLLLLFTALLLLVSRRYALLIPVAALMALTRPSGLAFALALLLHLGYRWWTRHRDPFPAREVVGVVVVGLTTALAGVAWLLVAALVTGDPAAYLETEYAWRAAYLGPGEVVPFTPWFQGAHWWFAFWWQLPEPVTWALAVAAVLALLAGFAAAVASPWMRRLGPDIRFWLIAYALYLLAVFFPQSSTFRLLVPLAPALGALAVPESRVWRAVLLVLGVVGQVVWTAGLWRAETADWTPP